MTRPSALPGGAELRAAIERVMPAVLDDLAELMRIPSVSEDAFDQRHVLRSARLTADLLRASGLHEVEILQVEGGRPAVMGRTRGPEGAPTVLLYAHHDVQPPGEREDWYGDPFEPVERDGRLFGRGAADDKAGIAVHLAALRAYGGRPPVGVIVFVEGEEEIGSPTLRRFLHAYGERLSADVMVLADSTNWAVGTAALTTSLRGVVTAVMEVRTATHAVHSGLHGGPVPDALTALVRLLASLHDQAGDVAIKGLVTAQADPLDLTEERMRAEAALLDGVQLIGTGSVAERLWTRPAVSVIGVDAPSIEEAANALLPVARAKVSLRIAPGDNAQRAMDALVEHLESHTPWGAQLRVEPQSMCDPVQLATTGPAYEAADRALTAAWGTPPVRIGVGGSVPFIAAFADRFPAAQILVTGLEDPASHAHAANESLHLGDFARACLAEALLLRELADQASQ